MPFKKGQSGNPGGRKKRTPEEFDLIAAARSKAPAALEVMRQLMDSSLNDRVRLSAAIAIIERAYGAAPVMPPGGDAPTPVQVVFQVKDASVPEGD